MTTENNYDAIIIGAGVQGASLAYHLARRGVKVIVLEKKFAGAGATGRSSVAIPDLPVPASFNSWRARM